MCGDILKVVVFMCKWPTLGFGCADRCESGLVQVVFFSASDVLEVVLTDM